MGGESWKEFELPRRGDTLRWSGFETRCHRQYRKGDINGKEQEREGNKNVRERNVGNYQSKLLKSPKERKSNSHGCGSPISRTFTHTPAPRDPVTWYKRKNVLVMYVCILRHVVYHLQSYWAPVFTTWRNFATCVFSVMFAINTDQFSQGLTDWFAWFWTFFFLSAIGTEFKCIILKNLNLQRGLRFISL